MMLESQEKKKCKIWVQFAVDNIRTWKSIVFQENSMPNTITLYENTKSHATLIAPQQNLRHSIIRKGKKLDTSCKNGTNLEEGQ